MLSAEHYALENKAIQSMLAIREKELNYIDTRMAALGTQSSLLAGFIIANFVNNFLGPHSGTNTAIGTQYLMYISTGVAMAASFHCILNSTFLCIWGPGLALRGGMGSVSRAYSEMKAERNQIVMSFNLSVVFFGFQCIATFLAYDGQIGLTWYAAIACVVLVVGAFVTFRFIIRMRSRMGRKEFHSGRMYKDDMIERTYFQFFCGCCSCIRRGKNGLSFDTPMMRGALDEKTHSQNVNTGLSMPLIQKVGGHEDWSNDLAPSDYAVVTSGTKGEGQTARHKKLDTWNVTNMASNQGWLMKRSSKYGIRKYQRRYFVLRGCVFEQFRRQEDHTAAVRLTTSDETEDDENVGTEAEKDRYNDVARSRFGMNALPLVGYEVLLNPNDPNFQFQLQPLSNHNRQRVFCFRASSAEERDTWVQALLAACIMAQDLDQQ